MKDTYQVYFFFNTCKNYSSYFLSAQLNHSAFQYITEALRFMTPEDIRVDSRRRADLSAYPCCDQAQIRQPRAKYEVWPIFRITHF